MNTLSVIENVNDWRVFMTEWILFFIGISCVVTAFACVLLKSGNSERDDEDNKS